MPVPHGLERLQGIKCQCQQRSPLPPAVHEAVLAVESIEQLLEPTPRRAMAEESTACTSPNSTQTRAGAGMIKQPDPVTWVLVLIIGV
jgi:hypothetical protein